MFLDNDEMSIRQTSVMGCFKLNKCKLKIFQEWKTLGTNVVRFYVRKPLCGCYIGEGERRHSTMICLPAWVSFMVAIRCICHTCSSIISFLSLRTPQTYIAFLLLLPRGLSNLHVEQSQVSPAVCRQPFALKLLTFCPLLGPPTTATIFLFALSNFQAFLHVSSITWQLL